ncbi:hypothetical protein ARHIZOSPH14_17700 [Agromyces rhizosphaerae]|uniref:Uncharacterized protein n=1 Tax=Agromyces rhizosphaerae TaxID=88374 RepID=A0A9W6FRW7_9MICO|nr:hypothetical protein [Agromyces rhizosphaerae]GLI27528.1 hypothetical protein ARHIZOSPH14_17700 [Agromyces rhizosphaerae]
MTNQDPDAGVRPSLDELRERALWIIQQVLVPIPVRVRALVPMKSVGDAYEELAEALRDEDVDTLTERLDDIRTYAEALVESARTVQATVVDYAVERGLHLDPEDVDRWSEPELSARVGLKHREAAHNIVTYTLYSRPGNELIGEVTGSASSSYLEAMDLAQDEANARGVQISVLGDRGSVGFASPKAGYP